MRIQANNFSKLQNCNPPKFKGVYDAANSVNLGAETVPYVKAGNSATLNGTKVQGNVKAGNSITANNAEIQGEAKAGNSINSTGSTFKDFVIVGNELTVSNSAFKDFTRAGNSIEAHHCTFANVEAGNDGEFKNCPSISNIKIKAELYLEKSNVLNDVSATDAIIKSSNIGGTLSLATQKASIKQSKLNNIKLSKPIERQSISGFSNIIMSGVIGSSITMSGSRMMISASPGGRSSVNGIKVNCPTNSSTRLELPDGNVFINGDLISGSSPYKTYTEYKKNHPAAPMIKGPGWKDEGTQDVTGSEKVEKPVQELVLDGTQVSGKILFEEGNGKITLKNGATLDRNNLVGVTAIIEENVESKIESAPQTDEKTKSIKEKLLELLHRLL